MSDRIYTYDTRDDAIWYEIIVPIEAGEEYATNYNIDAIADKVIGDHSQGYARVVSEDEFWRIVAENERRGA